MDKLIDREFNGASILTSAVSRALYPFRPSYIELYVGAAWLDDISIEVSLGKIPGSEFKMATSRRKLDVLSRDDMYYLLADECFHHYRHHFRLEPESNIILGEN